MFFERIVSPGLAHHSYFVSDGSEAVVIDPRRDVELYLELAAKQQAHIRYVLETHRQEDFVLGSRELADRTGARILHGEALPYRYGEPIADGEELAVGDILIRAVATPGHTAESMTYALSDRKASLDPVIACTGDALFIGDVGRTDLYGDARRNELAAMLYDSLWKRILPLGDGVVIAPAHGGGSVCGASILARTQSTVGFERLHNPSLRVERDAFIRDKAAQRMVVPPYFHRMEAWNLDGPPIVGRVPDAVSLSLGEFGELAHDGAVIVDTRMPQAFAAGHIPGAYNIWLDGLQVYAGWVLPPDRPLLLVMDDHVPAREAIRMLFRVGFDQVRGYLKGGFETWQNAGRPLGRTATVTAPEVRTMLQRGAVVLDARNADEWTSGVLPDSILLNTAELEGRIDDIPRDRPVISTCSVGHRGGIGASILQRHGFEQVYQFMGGVKAWQAMEYPVEQGPDSEELERLAPSTSQAATGHEVEQAMHYLERRSP